MPQFGTQERQRVINEMHARMLELEVSGQKCVQEAQGPGPPDQGLYLNTSAIYPISIYLQRMGRGDGPSMK